MGEKHITLARTFVFLAVAVMHLLDAPIVTSQSSQTLIFLPTDDGQVKLTAPGNNYGTKATAKVDAGTFDTYLKFNVTGISGSITTAILRLKVSDGSSDGSDSGGSIYSVGNNYDGTSTAWDESGLTAGNAPLISGSPLSTIGAVNPQDIVEFDVKSAISGDGIYSFAISTASTNLVKYFTKDSTNVLALKPRLIVTVDGGSSNNPPVAQNDVATTPVDTAVDIDVLANDTDPDGSIDVSTVAVVTQPGNGSATVNTSNGNITYTPDGGFVGTDNLTYTVNDDQGAPSNAATVTITVSSSGGGQTLTFQPTDDGQVKLTAPGNNYGTKATAKVDAGSFDTYLKFNVTGISGSITTAILRLKVTDGSSDGSDSGGSMYSVGNNYDGTSTPWDESGLTAGNAPLISGSPLSTIGAVNPQDIVEFDVKNAISGDGIYSFAISTASTDQVKYFTKDSTSVLALKPRLIVTVNGGSNNPPVAQNDVATTPVDTAVDIDVLANDTDSDGSIDATTVIVTGAPSTGSTSVNATTGFVTYTPNTGFSGTDSFTYTVNDNEGATSNQATVTVTVGNIGAGNALFFDGSTEYVEIADVPLLSGGSGKSITVEAWIKVSTLGVDRPIVTKFLDSNIKDWGLKLKATGALEVAIENTDNWTFEAGTITVLTWTHVAFTFDNPTGQVRLYMNGVEVGNTTYGQDMPDSIEPVAIGRISYNGQQFHGVIDEVRIWNYARSATEISNNWDIPLGGVQSNLIGYWSFDEGSGEVTADISGSGNTGTLLPSGTGPAWQISDASFEPPPPTLSFTDITISAGTAGPGQGGHSANFTDVDEDSRPDLYMTMLFNGQSMSDLFFRNTNGSQFAEEGTARGIADFDGGSHGATFADLDNDGDFDLYNGTTGLISGGTTAAESNNIFQNDGNGFFTDITSTIGITFPQKPTRAVVAFDMDNDGDLDLFAVTNSDGSNDPPGETNEVYRNDGNMQFTAITSGNLYTAPAGQGAVDTDYDNDGDIDIIAGNRTGDLNILNNDGQGNFTAISPATIGITHQGREGASMGDIDNDGDLDMLLADYDDTQNYHIKHLYRNNGNGTFTFVITFQDLNGYMGGFADLDNDGDLDLVGAGDEVCFINDGTGTFSAGPSVPVAGIDDPRAIAFADIDGDGDLDFAIGAKDSRNWLVLNNFNSGNWLKVKLRSPQGQIGAFGAKTRIYAAGGAGGTLLALRESRSNNGYLGQDDPILHFGLDSLTAVDVQVTFLNGLIVTQSNVAANQTIFIDATGQAPWVVNGNDITQSLPVVIGQDESDNPDISFKLSVFGKARVKEINVDATWSDFVFDDDYDLMSLEELHQTIQKNKHLPGIPSDKEVAENGIMVGAMHALLLQKIEELTLYVIEIKKRNLRVKEAVEKLEKSEDRR